jgi:hypothetical protein
MLVGTRTPNLLIRSQSSQVFISIPSILVRWSDNLQWLALRIVSWSWDIFKAIENEFSHSLALPISKSAPRESPGIRRTASHFSKSRWATGIDTRKIVLMNVIHRQPDGLLAMQAIHQQLQYVPFERMEEHSPPSPSDSWRLLVHHHLSPTCRGLK